MRSMIPINKIKEIIKLDLTDESFVGMDSEEIDDCYLKEFEENYGYYMLVYQRNKKSENILYELLSTNNTKIIELGRSLSGEKMYSVSNGNKKVICSRSQIEEYLVNDLSSQIEMK